MNTTHTNNTNSTNNTGSTHFNSTSGSEEKHIFNDKELQEALEAIRNQGFKLIDRLTRELPLHFGEKLQPEDIDRMLDAIPVDDPQKMAQHLQKALEQCVSADGKLKQECLDILNKKEGSPGYEYLSGKSEKASNQAVSLFTLLLLLAQLAHERWQFMDQTARFIHFERVMGSYKDMLGAGPEERNGFLSTLFTGGYNSSIIDGHESQGSMWWKSFDEAFGSGAAAIASFVVMYVARIGVDVDANTASMLGQTVGQGVSAPSRFLSSGQDIEVNRARMMKEMGDFLKQKFGDMKRELDQRRDSMFRDAKDLVSNEAQSKSSIGRNIA